MTAPTGADHVIARRLRPFGTTIFTEMSALAIRTGALNLGQGFPDTDGPAEIMQAVTTAMRSGHAERVRAAARACPSCARRSPITSGAGTASSSIRTTASR